MTNARAMKGVLVLVLCALVPGGALAVDVTGRVGLGYSRTDTWTGDYKLSEPHLGVDAGLGAVGYVVSPGIVDWSLDGGYTNTQDMYTGTTSRADGLTYGANLGLLEARGTKLSLGGYANRTRQEFSSESSGITTTGSSISDVYGVRFHAGAPGLPNLYSSFSYADTTNHGFDRADTRQTWHTFDVGGSLGPFGLQVDYGLRWNDGDLIPVNYVSQLLRVSSHNRPTDRVGVSFDANWFDRTPSTFAPGNPRYQDTLVLGGADWTLNSTDAVRAQYRYSHNLVVDPALATREQLGNGLSLSYRQRLSPEWTGTWGASASMDQFRLGTSETMNTGQSLDAAGIWQRSTGARTYGADVGARLALLEPETGGAQGGYGVSAGANTGWRGPFHEYALSYMFGYDSNVDASQGWTTHQSAAASASGLFATQMSLTGRLEASAARGGGGPFGDNATRSVTARGAMGYRRLSLSLDAAISDAVTGALSNPVSDGLFLPPGYNTHQRSLGLSGTVRLAPQLTARARTRYAVATGPTTPEQREAYVEGGLLFVAGAWVISFDDRYTMGGAALFDQRVNQLMFHINRVFGTK
jgi:hypothetical protein